jgi:hypothetical protein
MTTARKTTGTVPVVRDAVALSLLAGLVASLVALLTAGLPGLYGTIIGTVVVVAFFVLGHLALSVVRNVDPGMFFLIAMLTYVLQVVALFGFFRTFATWSADVSATALGGTIVACTVCWTIGLVLSSRRQRIPLFDLGEEGR